MKKYLQIEITDSLLNALIDSKKCKEKVSISFCVDNEESKSKQAKPFFKFSENELLLIKKWNTEVKSYQKTNPHDKRNQETTMKEFSKEIETVIKPLMKRMKVEEVIKQIDFYFLACKKCQHLKDGRNFGFKNLLGFLRKLNKNYVKGEKGWWDNSYTEPFDDKYKKTTRLIANEFAIIYLNRDRYNLINPSRDYETFMSTAKKIKYFMKRNPGLPFDRQEIIEYFLKAVKRYTDNSEIDTVYPKILLNNNVWNIIFPQYLKEIYPSIEIK